MRNSKLRPKKSKCKMIGCDRIINNHNGRPNLSGVCSSCQIKYKRKK